MKWYRRKSCWVRRAILSVLRSRRCASIRWTWRIIFSRRQGGRQKSRHPTAQVHQELLSRYDKDKNNKLSREESGFPKELFDALDANKDGELDALELLRWLIAAPDLDITVRLGNVERNLKLIESATGGKGRSGLQPHATSTTTLALSFENSEVSIVRGNFAAGDRAKLKRSSVSAPAFKQFDKRRERLSHAQANRWSQAIALRQSLPLRTVTATAD